jgi:GT2 family glycosyltransferase
VKQGVFEDMPRPWFVEKFEKVVDEQTGKDMFVPYGEDFSWCISARECGFSIYIDPTVNVSHHKKVAIKP